MNTKNVDQNAMDWALSYKKELTALDSEFIIELYHMTAYERLRVVYWLFHHDWNTHGKTPHEIMSKYCGEYTMLEHVYEHFERENLEYDGTRYHVTFWDLGELYTYISIPGDRYMIFKK